MKNAEKGIWKDKRENTLILKKILLIGLLYRRYSFVNWKNKEEEH
jgi:hypothetical protein